MKLKLIVLTILLSTNFFNCQEAVPIRQIDTQDAEKLMPEIVQAVQENHFNPRAIDDQLSQDIFDYYIESLDTQKEFFTQEDVEQLSKHQLSLDEDIINNNFEFFNTAVSHLENGIAKAEKYSNQLLNNSFDFSIKENLEINFSKLAYAKNDKALKDRWRKKMKKYILDQLYIEEKNNPSLEEEKLILNAKDNVKKLLAIKINKLKNIKDRERIEGYANAFLKVQDYQSTYMSPKEKSDWNDKYQRSFVGIGTRLLIENGYPYVEEVIVGGPVWKAKSLEIKDVILKVKEKNKEAVDLIGKPMVEIISLLKGEKGTSIYLTVKKDDASIEEVEIIRDKIDFDLAMSFLLEDKESKQKIGYIRLPRFYSGDPGSAVHVLKEIETLKANKVEGIIFDVRNNTGGSSGVCRDMIGYFLKDGIYMQTNRGDGDINQYSDNDPAVQYEGELLIMTNSRSGSASELFSGTLQDYKRALIVGSESTFGKGSMQNFIEMNSEENASKFGEIKMSVGLFYTASGRSPQSTGIIPDITLTDDSKYVPSGERAQAFSMPADALPKTKVSQDINVVENINQLKTKSNQRTKSNKRFQLADKKAKQLLEIEESNLIALDIDGYKKQKDSKADLEIEFEEIFSDIKDFEVSFDETPFAQDSASIINRERWINTIKSDPYIYECYQIMSDMIG